MCDARGRPPRRPGSRAGSPAVAPAAARGDVTIVLTSDARMRTLNREYRGEDYATDVLSFPVTERTGSGDSPREAGECRATSATS